MTDYLAKIARITGFREIPKATQVTLAIIDDGWLSVVKKTDFMVGDQIVYCRVGCIMPKHAEYDFLKGSPLKTKKFLGIISQGLALPVRHILLFSPKFDLTTLTDGMDVTRLMNIEKYIPLDEKEPENMKSNWIPDLPKTDEPRLQGMKKQLNEFTGKFIITKKDDGCSFTAGFYEGRLRLLSRNNELSEEKNENTHFYKIANKYKFTDVLKEDGIFFQGEICGPKVNGNRLKLTDYRWRVFNIYDIRNGRYLIWNDLVEKCQTAGFETVEVVYRGEFGSSNNEYKNIDFLVKLANGQKYDVGIGCEGIVLKSDYYGNNFHGKIISPEYEVKHNL